MQTIGIYIAAALLVGAGCAATVLSAYVFPLWIRVLGQPHGRFAGLSATELEPVAGSRRKIGGTGRAAVEQPVSSLIVA
jgi:hypothetical protein